MEKYSETQNACCALKYFPFKTVTHPTGISIGSSLGSFAHAIRDKSHSYLLQLESVVDKSIHHPVETMMANEPWLLFSVCFSAITSVGLLLSSKSTRANELVFDKACLILWVSCSVCLFLSVGYTNSAAMGAVWLSTYLTEVILSLENMLAYHAVFSLHRVVSSDRPKGLYWGIGLAMFIRFVFLIVGGALVSGSSIARLTIGGSLVVMGLLTASSLIDASQQRRAKAFQIASSVCSFCEKIVPTPWWESFTTVHEDQETAAPILLQGQSKWAIGVPIFVTVVAVELCDSFLTMWNTLAVVSQTSSLFVTYSSTAFALMTVRALYLVMVGQNTAVEPRLKYTGLAGGLVTVAVGGQLLVSYARFGADPSVVLSTAIGIIGLGLAGVNAVNRLQAAR